MLRMCTVLSVYQIIRLGPFVPEKEVYLYRTGNQHQRHRYVYYRSAKKHHSIVPFNLNVD